VPRWLIVPIALLALPAAAAEWVLSMAEPRVKAGARFELELRAPAGEALPDAIGLRVRGDRAGRVIAAQASAPAAGARRAYAGVVPQTASAPWCWSSSTGSRARWCCWSRLPPARCASW